MLVFTGVIVTGILGCMAVKLQQHRLRPMNTERMTAVTPPYMHKRSSCFSCERQARGSEWSVQPSKCFSCERQMVAAAAAAAAAGDEGRAAVAPFLASRSWHTA